MIIALLTDFGTKDYFVGAMKGVILSINPQANIIDITHEIEPQNVQSAGFTLASCYRDFPPKTIFVAVVDPGVGSDRRAVLVETDDHFFVAPDNGLLSLALANEPNYKAFELTESKFFRQSVSQTFHGRDVFAPVAAWISKGVNSNAFGAEVSGIISDKSLHRNKFEGQIIHIDHFGNLITNLKRTDLPEKFSLQINQTEISQHHNSYLEAEADELFSIWGSAGYLEIVAFCNSAKELLNVEINQKILVKLR